MGATIKPDELKKALNNKKDLKVLDVRRKADFEADGQIIPGASYRDPDKIEQWSKDLKEGQEVVIYCARGGSVSRSVSEKLREKKIRVSFIEGGIAAWKESGGEVRSGG